MCVCGDAEGRRGKNKIKKKRGETSLAASSRFYMCLAPAHTHTHVVCAFHNRFMRYRPQEWVPIFFLKEDL